MSSASASSSKNDLGLATGEELRAPKLSHMVAERLRGQIASGQLKPGTNLPSEAELLTILKVSRPTLREALRILEAEGLISVWRGVRNGAMVLGASVDKIAEYTTLLLATEGVTMLDLHNARSFFEPAIIRSLAELSPDASGDAARQLGEIVGQVEASLAAHDYPRVVAQTQKFHALIAKASGNRTIALLVGVLHMISDDMYTSALAQEGSRGADALHKNMTKTVSGYRALVDLLEKGKFEEAGAFWDRYMERSRDFLKATKLGTRQVLHKTAAAGGAR